MSCQYVPNQYTVKRVNTSLNTYDPWGNPPEPTWFEKLANVLKGRSPRVSPLWLLLLLVIAWLCTGIYTVQPGEVAVIRRFGKYTGITEPGLRFRLPQPIETHHIVDIEQVRRVEIGFRSEQTTARQQIGPVAEEALMLTGDENIVEVHVIVQYVVDDPASFLFRVKEPEQTLHAAAEVAVRSVIGDNTIDYAMSGAGRSEQQAEVQEYLQMLLDQYETGLRTTEVRFTVVDAPVQVRDAFHDVIRAYEERERRVNQARAYEAEVLPRARGEAQQLLRQADAYREERVLQARGDAERFLQMLAEYEHAPDVTRQRMYLEAIERALANTRKFILSDDTGQPLPLFSLNNTDGLGGTQQ